MKYDLPFSAEEEDDEDDEEEESEKKRGKESSAERFDDDDDDDDKNDAGMRSDSTPCNDEKVDDVDSHLDEGDAASASITSSSSSRSKQRRDGSPEENNIVNNDNNGYSNEYDSRCTTPVQDELPSPERGQEKEEADDSSLTLSSSSKLKNDASDSSGIENRKSADEAHLHLPAFASTPEMEKKLRRLLCAQCGGGVNGRTAPVRAVVCDRRRAQGWHHLAL